MNPGVYLGQFWLGMSRWPLRTPTQLGSMLWPIIDPILVSFEERYISRFQHSHFLFSKLHIYLIDPFNCVIIKWNDTFVKMNIEHVLYSHFCTANRPLFFNTQTPYFPEYSYPRIPKICDPILVTLLKMQPHYSQSSHENATPSSGTSPLACY